MHEHVQKFTEKSLECLINKLNLKIIELNRTNRNNIYCILEKK